MVALKMGNNRVMGNSNGLMDHFIVEITIKEQDKAMANISTTKTLVFQKEYGEMANFMAKEPTSNQQAKLTK